MKGTIKPACLKFSLSAALKRPSNSHKNPSPPLLTKGSSRTHAEGQTLRLRANKRFKAMPQPVPCLGIELLPLMLQDPSDPEVGKFSNIPTRLWSLPQFFNSATP